jgi:hypothetical protein
MNTPEFLGAIGGNEAKGVVYASMQPGVRQTRATLFERVAELQDFQWEHKPAQRTLYCYTNGFVKAELGVAGGPGDAPEGFVSHASPSAIAFAGMLGMYSIERPWLCLNDLIEANRGSMPRMRAVRALLEHPEGLSVTDLNQLVLGSEARYRSSPQMYYNQLDAHGIADVIEQRGGGNDRAPKTRVTLKDDAVNDCWELVTIVERFADPSKADIVAGVELSGKILEDPATVRELIRKAYDTSPWAQSAKLR